MPPNTMSVIAFTSGKNTQQMTISNTYNNNAVTNTPFLLYTATLAIH